MAEGLTMPLSMEFCFMIRIRFLAEFLTGFAFPAFVLCNRQYDAGATAMRCMRFGLVGTLYCSWPHQRS